MYLLMKVLVKEAATVRMRAAMLKQGHRLRLQRNRYILLRALTKCIVPDAAIDRMTSSQRGYKKEGRKCGNTSCGDAQKGGGATIEPRAEGTMMRKEGTWEY